jgi:alanine dehydrogenase
MNPLLFVRENQINLLKPRSIIIDISCDEGMGFSFAKPTSFDSPTFYIGKQICYYSVDHTPSYLWDAASREISKAIIPFLSDIVEGEFSLLSNPILKKAIEIQKGQIINPKILIFQNRF